MRLVQYIEDWWDIPVLMSPLPSWDLCFSLCKSSGMTGEESSKPDEPRPKLYFCFKFSSVWNFKGFFFFFFCIQPQLPRCTYKAFVIESGRCVPFTPATVRKERSQILLCIYANSHHLAAAFLRQLPPFGSCVFTIAPFSSSGSLYVLSLLVVLTDEWHTVGHRFWRDADIRGYPQHFRGS